LHERGGARSAPAGRSFPRSAWERPLRRSAASTGPRASDQSPRWSRSAPEWRSCDTPIVVQQRWAAARRARCGAERQEAFPRGETVKVFGCRVEQAQRFHPTWVERYRKPLTLHGLPAHNGGSASLDPPYGEAVCGSSGDTFTVSELGNERNERSAICPSSGGLDGPFQRPLALAGDGLPPHRPASEHLDQRGDHGHLAQHQRYDPLDQLHLGRVAVKRVCALAAEPRRAYSVRLLLGGDMASTWVAKPEVHAEVRDTS
jgi:hypothetical protein